MALQKSISCNAKQVRVPNSRLLCITLATARSHTVRTSEYVLMLISRFQKHNNGDIKRSFTNSLSPRNRSTLNKDYSLDYFGIRNSAPQYILKSRCYKP